MINDDELRTISRRTVERYHDTAADFWQGTNDHDVSQIESEGQEPGRVERRTRC